MYLASFWVCLNYITHPIWCQAFKGVFMKKNKILDYRTKAGFTQRQLAELLSSPYQLIQKWEKGERCPSVYNALGIAKALNTTVEELFPVDE